MIAEAFENPWVKNRDGICPVDAGTLIDVKFRDGEIKRSRRGLQEQEGRDTQHMFWSLDGADNDIIAWRLHKADKYLEDAYDPHPHKGQMIMSASCLPSPKVIPPMPACKPSRQENSILSAFSELTGVIITDDQFHTLKVLMEYFGDD